MVVSNCTHGTKSRKASNIRVTMEGTLTSTSSLKQYYDFSRIFKRH